MTSNPAQTSEAREQWHQGWYAGAGHRPSPHFGVRPAGLVTDLLVVHSISLPPGIFEGNAVESLFMGTLDCSLHAYYGQLRGVRVSAHFFIRRNGQLLQFVSCDARAWHAGESSYRGRTNCNDDSIGVELEGLEGLDFETAQYTALATLTQSICARYPITQIAGHEHIAPGRKHDPGPGFDWTLLRHLLPEETLHFPPA